VPGIDFRKEDATARYHALLKELKGRRHGRRREGSNRGQSGMKGHPEESVSSVRSKERRSTEFKIIARRSVQERGPALLRSRLRHASLAYPIISVVQTSKRDRGIRAYLKGRDRNSWTKYIC